MKPLDRRTLRRGEGATAPKLLVSTLPTYTDLALKARAEGTVLLEVVVYKDGRVAGFRVVRPLGFGLDEAAIDEIATNWRVRPGTRDGRPVNVRAMVEVSVRLR